MSGVALNLQSVAFQSYNASHNAANNHISHTPGGADLNCRCLYTNLQDSTFWSTISASSLLPIERIGVIDLLKTEIKPPCDGFEINVG